MTRNIENYGFEITHNAQKQILKLLGQNPDKNFFRLSVNAGGCSGFQYEFSLDDKKSDQDILIENNGAKVLIDDVSISFLDSSHLDWVEELIGSSFKIINPNAKTSCGCGMSFSV
jgi:iron-sulfur cluster assembly accessory protein